MDRQESAAVLKDVVIYRSRSDVPADVVEAIDVAMQIFGREPRMEREKEARLTAMDHITVLLEQQIADLRRDREELDARVAQLEGAIDALFTVADEPGAFNRGDAAWAQLRAVRYGNATPTDREDR